MGSPLPGPWEKADSAGPRDGNPVSYIVLISRFSVTKLKYALSLRHNLIIACHLMLSKKTKKVVTFKKCPVLVTASIGLT